jgi:hypothetical protein
MERASLSAIQASGKRSNELICFVRRRVESEFVVGPWGTRTPNARVKKFEQTFVAAPMIVECASLVVVLAPGCLFLFRG